MTLDFKKLIKNALLKQLTIQHVEIPEKNVQIFKRDEINACEKVAGKMKSLYGQNSLLDGDYFIFFSNDGTNVKFDKEMASKTLFKVVNKALGETANDMRENELRLFMFDNGPSGEVVPAADIDDVEDPTADGTDEVNDAVVDRLVGGADNGEDQIDESVEAPVSGEKFIFLKITMK